MTLSNPIRSANSKANSRRAFSLLEVVLSLGILAVSVALLTQLIGLGFRNARQARSLTEAQMIAQSLIDQISLGILPPDPIDEVPVGMMTEVDSLSAETDAEWTYSIDQEPAPVDGLLMVIVRVQRANVQSASQNDSFQLVRWIRDPDLVLEEIPESSDAAPVESEGTL